MSKKIVNILLIGIIFIASFLRLWQLGMVPPSPDWDEVALGYDAYSIIHTGRDEYGTFMPVVFRSFDDYKPGLYTYLAIPAIELFGLNVFATRLPSAVFGILTVIAAYFLVKELFNRKEIALLSAFLLSISPWHIQFSRVAFESNVGLAFNVFTALFFLKGLKKPKMLSIAAICAAFSIYAYQSEKVFTPLLVVLLCSIYYKSLFKVKKKFLISAIVAGLIVIFPMLIYISTHKEALLRAQATMAFSDKTVFLKQNIIRVQNDKQANDIIGKLLDNRRLLYIKTGISGYLSHYDLKWLFIEGDNTRHHAPGMGLLYLFELPFIFIGIFLLLFKQHFKEFDRRSSIFVLVWFLITPIPAAFTSGVPHAVRTLNFLPTFQIFSAIGIVSTLSFVTKYKKNNLRIFLKCFFVFFFIFAIFNFAYFIDQYFVQQNYFHAPDWQYGYEQLIPEMQKVSKNYSKIVVTDRNPLDKSYMFFLFYLKYPPADYQKVGIKSSGGFASGHMFDKYKFRLLDWKTDSEKKGILYIGTPVEFPENIDTIKTIYYPNGVPAIKMVGT